MTRTRMTRAFTGAAAALWMGVIFRLSALPGSAVPGEYGTLGHFVLYAILGALYLMMLPKEGSPWRAAGLAVLLASLYGVTDEFHQSFVPGRVPDVLDWLVDTAGALVAVSLIQAVRHIAARRAESTGGAC